MLEELTLLPCPACGEEADILDSFERDGKGHVAIGWSVYCTRGCLLTSERGSREEAAALWNALPRALEWTDERFAILVRDMRTAQKRYFDTRDKADLSRAKELEKKVDDELALIFGGIQTQGALL